ncbi:MAG TPA: hypothetical protein PKB04_00510 [Phenylobacterium sp.]|nr:hypothetical protein [Phenylobacterium sp.]HMP63428.1 hypothetical protein [Phenylobacterium sp.]
MSDDSVSPLRNLRAPSLAVTPGGAYMLSMVKLLKIIPALMALAGVVGLFVLTQPAAL